MIATSNQVTVGAVQLTSDADPERNILAAIDGVGRAAAEGATYVQLPEYFNYLGPSRHFAEVAESIPGPTSMRMAEIAKTHHVTLHLGSMLEKSDDPTHFYNTSVVLDESGSIVARYRKVHLFDVDVPDAVVTRESDALRAGDSLVVARLPSMQLGMSICFDLRFPELYRSLAMAGATVLAIPAAFNAVTGEAHWEMLVRARAIENHAFVVAAAQAGTTGEGISSYGHSIIVGPWGDVIAQSQSSGVDVIVASIDVGQVALRRAQIAVLDLRRPGVYGSAVSS